MSAAGKLVRKSEALVGLVHDARRLLSAARRPADARRVRRYFDANRIRKLQLGAGPTLLEGWLCTDLAPRSPAIVHLDVRKPFPFADAAFDYLFSEHMIEHLSWDDARHMLLECHRILKPGGIIRTATPDLAVLLGLYGSTREAIQERYIKWSTDTFLPGVDVYKPQFVINNMFYNWGHRFLYDGELLELTLRKAGFADVARCRYGESAHEHLRGLETHGTNVGATEAMMFESMVYEARRPEH